MEEETKTEEAPEEPKVEDKEEEKKDEPSESEGDSKESEESAEKSAEDSSSLQKQFDNHSHCISCRLPMPLTSDGRCDRCKGISAEALPQE